MINRSVHKFITGVLVSILTLLLSVYFIAPHDKTAAGNVNAIAAGAFIGFMIRICWHWDDED